ncbi:MAG: FAD:protein FMN transferase [Paracoccaceae bacterium]
MRNLTRRRFLAITAGATLCVGRAEAAPLRQWRGSALGAEATITLRHPDGATIARRAFDEIDRLEDIFSLYRPGSALSRLNKTGHLPAPPFELLECLGLCGAVHRASGGQFDPSVQPLWALYAETHADGRAPRPDEIEAARARVGWSNMAFGPEAVRLRPGMALTLNGIAQGYVADRVAGLLRAEGLTDILVNTGEFHALGGDWPIGLDAGERSPAEKLRLRDRALASSAPLGTVFDRAGREGHILDPATGRPAPPLWRLISVTAPSAALADALSTAMVLMGPHKIDRVLQFFPGAELVAAVPAA